jgi:predicted RNA-binding Zn-ribbon protein involved in translation (DUF1610 family)
MASKSNKGPGGVPRPVVASVAHVAFDLATQASCPACGNQVVLYVCFSCKKVVRPQRGQAPA